MAATSDWFQGWILAWLVVLAFLPQALKAAVLPEERSDALYHYYDGGGVEIQGPSILVRKSFKDKVSVSANYYVDNVSSASIDVVSRASAYREKREEKSLGVDYLQGKTLMSLNYTQSEENDFSAKSAHFNLSQDFFGDLTTLFMGYSQGWDTVGKRGEPEFAKDNNRRQFRLGLTQVITKNSLVSLGWENISDQGYLNNPYRAVRYLDESALRGYDFQDEIYPQTRTSDALGLSGIYYLPYRASIKLQFKAFTDTWGIDAKTEELVYVHPLGERWTFEAKLRHYRQNEADFYQDLFLRLDAQNFMARDKELSRFSANSFGLGVSYEQKLGDSAYFDRYSVSFNLDRIQYDYDNFRDIRASAAVGEEPLYQFDAQVVRLFLSAYY